jgi:hypothetical protein
MSELLNEKIIRKIRTSQGDHEISAKYWGDKTFDEVAGLIHGVVGTYVIPVSNSEVDGYEDIVKSSDATITVSSSVINSLIYKSSDSDSDTVIFKVGDIILLEAISNEDDVKAFDRWVSKVDGDNITLSVLETQVSTHHHTIERTTDSAITSVETTTVQVANVGTAVTVTSDEGTYVTSVAYGEDEGGHTFNVVAGTTEDGVGHKHDIAAHEHTVTINTSDFAGSQVEAYTSLTSDSYTPHTHTSTDVASVSVSDTDITYVNGGTTDVFVKSLKDSSTASDTGSSKVTISSTSLTTDDIAADTVTSTSGAHTHTVNAETTTDVVSDITLASSVITSVELDYTAPVVEESVVTDVEVSKTSAVTSVSYTGPSTVVSGVTLDVVDGDVLCLTPSISENVNVTFETGDVVSGVTVSSGTQSSGSASLTKNSEEQTYTSGKVAFTCTTDEAGSHTHGFSHTHAIQAHTHDSSEHTHTYYKQVADVTSNAYVSLDNATYSPHKHESSVNVIATATNGDNLTFVTGGTKTSVLGSLASNSVTLTTSSEALETDEKYYKLDGTITFPGLVLERNKLATTTITPAVAGEEVVSAVTTTSSSFVTGVSEKTSENKGGK